MSESRSGAFNDYLSGNTNVPGSGLQPVHVDDGQLWPDLNVAHPPARLRGEPGTRRFMIAMIHSVAWYRRTDRFPIGAGARAGVRRLSHRERHSPGGHPRDHLTGNAPYAYTGPD